MAYSSPPPSPRPSPSTSPRPPQSPSTDPQSPALPLPPVVISEADFREKVREKRVGILKPQGSLERAREERAMASTQDDPEPACQEADIAEDSCSKGEDKKELRKPRVNIAMAAIMRKQEETNKQVKFVTPPPTPDSTADTTEKPDQDKPKVIQPKAIKGLVALPLGRKTGGILSLKDKSAGYPHLVNTDPEPAKKPEKEEKKDQKANQPGTNQNSQGFQPKRQDQPTSPNWSQNPQPNTFNDGPRMNFQKNYGIQNSGIAYNPAHSSPTNTSSQSIRLPVVNPKEIDVRTAALQKQTSRSDMFQENKFGAHGYQMSGDKKNFLNDLPPRFANQYRYWQAAQDSQISDNKFRDDNFKNNSLFNQSTNWRAPQQPQEFQQPPWWKPNTTAPPNFNSNFSNNMQPNYYSPHLTSTMQNPYQSLPTFNPMQNSNLGGPQKPELLTQPGYSAIGQPQLQSLQSIVSSPNFSSSLNNFGSYAPPVGYDSSMYPQFGSKLNYQPMQKPPASGYPVSNSMMDMGGLSFGSNVMDAQRNMIFNDGLGGRDMGAMKNLEQNAVAEGLSGEPSTNTYSLFSGAAPAPGQHLPQQSLWSGPGPSPLERLLEQQKQMKPQ
ncbi:hypothetical protein evm_000097 [Chilo suppressalis]|nr:hypothetical protein evm_000097 [Chilo suppressalis]